MEGYRQPILPMGPGLWPEESKKTTPLAQGKARSEALFVFDGPLQAAMKLNCARDGQTRAGDLIILSLMVVRRVDSA